VHDTPAARFELLQTNFEPTMPWQRLSNGHNMNSIIRRTTLAVRGLAAAVLIVSSAMADDSLQWHSDREVLDANLKEAALIPTLEELAMKTGWHIYLEPTPGKTFTTEFKGLARGPAMRTLLGDMNYAFVPDLNGATRLFVFRTSQEAATVEIVGATQATERAAEQRHVPNQLIVQLKPGMKIEELAAKLGAKVKGRIGDLNAYLLEFEDAESVEAARQQLATNEDVDATDYNYYVDRPTSPQPVTGNVPAPVQLKLDPGSTGGKIVVGLIDTAIQTLGGGLDQFLLAQISVAGEAGTVEGVTHGTAMAETLLRSIQTATAGATGVQILPVDVYGANINACTFDVANGIVRAVNNTPSPTIINLSLGSYNDSPFLRSAIQQVTRLGVVVFAAAGNEPVPAAFYPAAWPEVVSVTAAQAPGQLASYANFAPSVDMMAPGSSVVYMNGRAYLVTGTSAASAYAAGLAAGLADAHGLTVQEAASSVQNALPAPVTPSK
jgi:hypothetical protein